MPFYIFSIVIQALLVFHVLKTGRDRYWIWLVIFVPFIGALAYIVMEILPDLRGSIGGQRAARKVRQALNPGADIRQAALAYEQSANAENARHYGAALLANQRYSEAIDVYQRELKGMFADDPVLLEGLAEARFGHGEYAETVETLDQLRERNPDYQSAHGHLVYARALEGMLNHERAEQEYQSLVDYYPGAEARYRYGCLLAGIGRREDARQVFERMARDAKLAPAHFRKSQKHWLKAASKALDAL